MFNLKIKKNKGVALIEVLVGAFILSAGVLVTSGVFSNYVNYALSNQKNIQASYLLEETLEVLSVIRDNNWSNISSFSTTTDYYLFFNGISWVSTTTSQYVDGEFLRKFHVYDVRRNGSGIISVSGTYDPNIKKITATIEYLQGHSTTTKSISTYVANIYE